MALQHILSAQWLFQQKLNTGLASVLHKQALDSWTLDKDLHLRTCAFQLPISALLMSLAFKHLSTFLSNISLTFRACPFLNPYHHYHSLQTDHFLWVFYWSKLASAKYKFFLLHGEPATCRFTVALQTFLHKPIFQRLGSTPQNANRNPSSETALDHLWSLVLLRIWLRMF